MIVLAIEFKNLTRMLFLYQEELLVVDFILDHKNTRECCAIYLWQAHKVLKKIIMGFGKRKTMNEIIMKMLLCYR